MATIVSPQLIIGSSHNALNTSFMSQKGTFWTALSTTTEKLDPWIIDSRASGHMMVYANSFFTYNLSLGHTKMKIVDGSFAIVAGIGIIVLKPHITLHDVLHVPKLVFNLLFISKLTKYLNYSIQFLPSHYEF